MSEDAAGTSIQIAVSACLIGEEVRYDGGHRRDGYVTGALGAAFRLVPECPEVGIGLGTPRPKIHLESVRGETRLIGARGEDLTEAMRAHAAAAAERFREAGVSGVVLKSRSPSCGLGDARVRSGETLSEDGTGLFAGGLATALPGPPRISEAGLADPARRDHWLTRVFGFAELADLERGGPDPPALRAFHERWTAALTAHSDAAASTLARLLAEAKGESAFPRYRSGFLAALAEAPTVESHHRVLLELAGRIDRPEKKRLDAEIARFRARRIPLAAPIRTLRALARSSGDAWLESRPATLGYREQIYPESRFGIGK